VRSRRDSSATEFADLLPAGATFVAGVVVDFHGSRLGLPGLLSIPAPADLPAGGQTLAVRLATVENASRLELVGPAPLAEGRLRFSGLVEEGRYAFVHTAAGWALSAAWWRGAASLSPVRWSPRRASRWFPSAARTDGTSSARRLVGLT
jgi:hypothetical protein